MSNYTAIALASVLSLYFICISVLLYYANDVMYIIPDSNFMFEWIQSQAYFNKEFSEVSSFFLIFIIYYLAHFIDLFGFLLPNYLLCFLIILYIIKLNSKRSLLIVFLSFILNFYLILALAGPSKELIITGLSLPYVYHLKILFSSTNKSFLSIIILVLISIVILFVRTGLGFFMLLFPLFFIFSKRHRRTSYGLFYSFIIFFEYGSRNIVHTIDFINRNMYVGDTYELLTKFQNLSLTGYSFIDSIIQFNLSYVYKYLLNVFSFSTYIPYFTTSLSILNCSYFLFGISIVILYFNFFLRYRKKILLCPQCNFIFIYPLVISLSSFAQTRFLMPIFPILILLFFKNEK